MASRLPDLSDLDLRGTAPTAGKPGKKNPDAHVVMLSTQKRHIRDALRYEKWRKATRDADDEAMAKYERDEMEKGLEWAAARIKAQQAAQREMLVRVGEIPTLVTEHDRAFLLFTDMLSVLIKEGDEQTLDPKTVERRVRIARDAFSIFGIRDLWKSLGGTEQEITQRVLGWVEPPEEVD
tara:strand:+ start:305 stop:844 length:540 start_codon:yes stop_codon:yes gene_type:complete